jgi:A/G-specific adenine glycosylase
MEEEESMVLPVAGIGTGARTFWRFPGCLLPCGKISNSMNSLPQSNGTSQEVKFRRLLLAWYDAHARDLPWRKHRDPYRVWVSEIMLQQTRVAAVIEHYHAFLRRFPTVDKLAAARESSVLAAWSGLGYYRRARMMHAAAKVIVRELGRDFPTAAEGLRALPGIGRYTSEAIASIAFGEPVAVVDGNVERDLHRFSGKRVAPEQVWKAAEVLLDRERPGDFNQAMMELGATVCTPQAPTCLMCPIFDLCATRGALQSAAKAAKQHKRKVYYALDCRDGAVYLVQRPRNARLMAGMWELPEVRASRGRAAEFSLRHSITVTDYTALVWRSKGLAGSPGKWVRFEKLSSLALTGLAQKILRKAELMSPRLAPV